MKPEPESWPSGTVQQEHLVNGHDAGIAGNLKFVNCLHYLQDAAETQANSIGVGLDYLRTRGLIWVLARYHIRLHRYPFIGDRLRVVTWPFGWQRLFAIREFVFIDAEGHRFGEASSAWLLVRSNDYRPVRPRDHLPEIPLIQRREIADAFTRLPAVENEHFRDNFKVRIHDLDVNRHVNNSIYVQWALETVPLEIWKTHRPHEVEVDFMAMAFLGESIEVTVEQLNSADRPTFLHCIRRTADRRELTRLRSVWRPMQQ